MKYIALNSEPNQSELLNMIYFIRVSTLIQITQELAIGYGGQGKSGAKEKSVTEKKLIYPFASLTVSCFFIDLLYYPLYI